MGDRQTGKQGIEVNEQAPLAEQDSPSSTLQRNSVAARAMRVGIVILALAALSAAFLWLWFDTHRQIGNLQQELARRLTEIEGSNKTSQILATQAQETARDLSAKLSLAEARFAEIQSQRAELDKIYRELSGNRDESTLVEVEQMLMIAGQHLQLSGNIKAALTAMQQADDRLKRLGSPALSSLRKAVSHDMDKLRTLPDADISGINLKLANVITAVDTLPLMQHTRVGQEAAAPSIDRSGWQKVLYEIWAEVKQLVHIENTQKSDLPLLSPTQAFYLRENLKLRLLSARLALLARDEADFRRNLQAAQDWVASYFDTKSSQSMPVVATLQKLRQSSISVEIPDISASLAAVRNFRTTR